MKYLFLLVLAIFFNFGFTQETENDSLRVANRDFDKKILEKIKTYEEKETDFIFLRVYDTLYPFKNRCRFLIKPDSCSKNFGWRMDQDYSIGYVSISNVLDAYSDQIPCRDEITQIETNWDGYFTDQAIDFVFFENSLYTVYGKINGKYLFENVALKEPNSMERYHQICRYLFGWC